MGRDPAVRRHPGTPGIATGLGYLLNNGQEISAIPGVGGDVRQYGNLGGWIPVPGADHGGHHDLVRAAAGQDEVRGVHAEHRRQPEGRSSGLASMTGACLLRIVLLPGLLAGWPRYW